MKGSFIPFFTMHHPRTNTSSDSHLTTNTKDGGDRRLSPNPAVNDYFIKKTHTICVSECFLDFLQSKQDKLFNVKQESLEGTILRLFGTDFADWQYNFFRLQKYKEIKQKEVKT